MLIETFITKHSILEISLYFFRHTYECLVFYNELLLTSLTNTKTGAKKCFQKYLSLKQLSKNSYVLETFQNDNQDKFKPFENSFLFFGKFGGSRDNVSGESFTKNSLGSCFIKYMISLSAVARLRNLEAKIPHIKKYMSQNPEKP